MVDKKFFEEYEGLQKERGIPTVKMNRPMATNVLVGSVGLELEIEGANLPRDGHIERVRGATSGAAWVSVTDGSLRGEAREYILSTPCTDDELDPLVTGLFKVFKDLGSTLNLSNRCSTHCHINMKGKTVNLVTSAITCWVMFEDVIVPWCGEERTTNHFCLTTKDAAASLLPAWESYLRTGAGNFNERDNLKYNALNIYPLFSKGSFEFRCGPRPETPEKVLAFARFCNRLISYSARYRNPQLIANDISEKGALQMFTEIVDDKKFLDEVISLAGGPSEFQQKCMDGFRRAQSIVMGHPWERWLSLIEKEFVPDPFRSSGGKAPSRVPPRRPVPDEDAPAIPENPELARLVRNAAQGDGAEAAENAERIFQRERQRILDDVANQRRNALGNVEFRPRAATRARPINEGQF